MGGDDLGSEDEYLTAPLRVEDDNDSSDDELSIIESSIQKKNTTKRPPGDDGNDNDAPVKKKRKRERGLGSDAANKSVEEQAKSLTEFAGAQFRSHQIAISDNRDSPSLTKRIQGVISKKKLKRFNDKGSPLVVILCLSARRAVSVLKELAPFNVRVAKLFPKQGSIQEQTNQLQSVSYGVAVCTPHRLFTLAKQGSVSFSQTQLVVLDTFVDNKKFSLDTLPDTAPHTISLLNEYIQPECQQRRTLRVALL
jgi:hypothetical protein